MYSLKEIYTSCYEESLCVQLCITNSGRICFLWFVVD